MTLGAVMSAQATHWYLHSKSASYALLALAAAASVIGLVENQRRADAELHSLPPAERVTLYERTVETLRSTCSHTRGEAFVSYCREQAQFLSRFSECNDDCQSDLPSVLFPAD